MDNNGKSNGYPNKGGRPKGSPNQTTVDIRELRSQCADLWRRTMAFNRLTSIAMKDDDGLFRVLEIMAKLLPRNVIENTGPTQIMVFNAAIHDASAVKVAEVLQADGNTGPVTPALCIEKLRVITQERLHGNGNGRDIPRHRDEEVRGPEGGDAGPG